MASSLANLNGASQIFSARLNKIKEGKPVDRPSTAVVSSLKKTRFIAHDQEPQSLQVEGLPWLASRRASLGLAVVTVFQQFGSGASQAQEEVAAEAENNGWWLTAVPLPVPTVTNKIANPETGTRSFLRPGIYVADIGPEGRAIRLKHYAFDLLALGDLLAQDAWSYVRKYLRLRSTVMYYDFDKVISAAPDEQKQPLTDLANRLFDSVEKLEEAVKKQDDPLADSCYSDTTVILKEVMDRMA